MRTCSNQESGQLAQGASARRMEPVPGGEGGDLGGQAGHPPAQRLGPLTRQGEEVLERGADLLDDALVHNGCLLAPETCAAGRTFDRVTDVLVRHVEHGHAWRNDTLARPQRRKKRQLADPGAGHHTAAGTGGSRDQRTNGHYKHVGPLLVRGQGYRRTVY